MAAAPVSLTEGRGHAEGGGGEGGTPKEEEGGRGCQRIFLKSGWRENVFLKGAALEEKGQRVLRTQDIRLYKENYLITAPPLLFLWFCGSESPCFGAPESPWQC